MHSLFKLPALAGILLFLSYYSGLLVPNLTLFVPLLLWLDGNPSAPAHRRMRAGFVFGLVAHLLSLHFHNAMLEYSWLAALLYVGFALALAIKLALAVGLLGWLRARTRLSWVWLLPVGWLPLEWASTWGDLRMTADHVAQTMAAFPFLVQFADLLGPYGVGAVVLACNALIYESAFALHVERRRRARRSLALLAILVLAYDAWAWVETGRRIAAAPTLRVAAVQPNIPLNVKHLESSEAEQWKVLTRLTVEAKEQGAELVIWPESARPRIFYHWPEMPQSRAMFDAQSLAREIGIDLVVGAEYARVFESQVVDYYNAAFLARRDGTLAEEWGGKVYLVPFTEGLPFRSLLGPLVEDRGGEWKWVAGGFTPAPRNALLPVGDTAVGVLVCYEQMFWDLARDLRNEGAGLQAVITNDAWFGRSVFQSYQANVVRLRSIENRTSFVRVANTGYTAFVDPRGGLSQRTKLFEETVVVADVPLIRETTPYDRLGDVVAWFAIAGLLLCGAIGLHRGPPRRDPFVL